MMKSRRHIEYFAIYTRRSVKSSLEIDSRSVQFEKCSQYAIQMMPYVYWDFQQYNDNGYSGDTLERPAMIRLREAVSSGKIAHLIVMNVDRLTRKLSDHVMLMDELYKFGVTVHFVQAPELNTSANTRFAINVLASFAEFEREMICTRLSENREYRKQQGRRLAGRIPFGYNADSDTKQLVVDPEEAQMIKDIFELAVDGETPSKIAQIINEKGWRTKKHVAKMSGNVTGGGPWLPRQISALLRNPVYIGMFKDGDSVRPGVHEAIIDSSVFDAVQRMIDARRTKKSYSTESKTSDEKFPLRGKILCSKCGRKLTTDTCQRKLGNAKSKVVYRYYRCRSTASGRPPCKGIWYDAYELEQIVCDLIGDTEFLQSLIETNLNNADLFTEGQKAWNLLDESTKHRHLIPIRIKKCALSILYLRNLK